MEKHFLCMFTFSLFTCAALAGFHSNLFLPQTTNEHFGEGKLKKAQDVIPDDKYGNITLWYLMNLTRKEYRRLRWALITGNRTENIPKKREISKQRDVEGILFEGDIKFNRPLMDKVRYLRWRRRNVRRPRAVSRWQNGRWPNATVPYLINKSVDIQKRDLIFRAMIHIERKTCIRFVEQTDQTNYVLFEGNGYMCASNVGMQGRGQQIISVRDCDNKGMLIHELCHSLGFWHEQSRPDRTQFVRILWGNIIPEKRINFARHTRTMINSFDVGYDLDSVMHYDLKAFSDNERPTMQVLNGHHIGKVGQRNGLSVKDAQQLNIMYQCPKNYLTTNEPTTSPPPQSFQYIKTGTVFALKSPVRNQWVLCTGYKCFTNGCPGRIFKTKNVNKCPTSMFAFDLVGSLPTTEEYIRNGDLVVLKRMYRGNEEDGQKWIFCGDTYCYTTDYCNRNGVFDISHCHHQVLKISVAGKVFGEKILTNDVINMEYRDPTLPAPSFGTAPKFSCFDNKGSTGRCNKQIPCDVHNIDNNNIASCQQTQFVIKKVPLPSG